MRTQLETRMLIVETLNQMLSDKSLQKISVGQLCARAGISRACFYKYFSTINEVPQWLWEHLFAESAGKIGHGLSLYEGHLLLYRSLGQYREFFRQAMRIEGVDSAISLINRSTLESVTKQAIADGDIRPTDAELMQVRFFNEGAVAMTRAWVLGDLDATPEAMSACFREMVPAFWRD